MKFTHQQVSFIKSGLRLAAYGIILLTTKFPLILGVFGLLLLAEGFGIVEEFCGNGPAINLWETRPQQMSCGTVRDSRFIND